MRLVVVVVTVLVVVVSNAAASSQTSDEAYTTLLYGDEYLLGARVLGKSIRDTRSTKDMVALVSHGVSDFAIKLLQADGWIVKKVSLLANPNKERPKKLWGVYTKLEIFNMTNYKKVVYLDADTIVIKSIEDIFKCGKFCAILKHSERMNSGVMVLEPSQKVFNDMMSKVNVLESYTGGEQGFLDAYYSGFANAQLFEPNLPPKLLNSRPVPEMQRLSTLYNADAGQYILSNKWKVNNASEICVIHYTLGPFKPWDWWTSWILEPVEIWQKRREQLADSLPGTGGGSNPHENFLVKFLFFLPFCTLLLCYYQSFLHECLSSLCKSSSGNHIRQLYYKIRFTKTLAYIGVSTSSTSTPNHQPKVPVYLGRVSIFVSFMAALMALRLALAIVPRQVTPWTGFILTYEWTFTIFFILFGGYIHLIYHWGLAANVQAGSLSSDFDSLEDNSGKGHQRGTSSCDFAAWYYGLGMAFLAVLTPSLPWILGITSLRLRLELIFAGCLILASFMTYASEHLTIRAFLRGLEDRDAAQSRKTCSFS